MVTDATGEDSSALKISDPYYPVKQIYIEPQQKHAPTHRLAYVDAQTSAARLQAAYPALQPNAYPDLIAALLAVSLGGDADAVVGHMTAAAYAIEHSICRISRLPVTQYSMKSATASRFRKMPRPIRCASVNDALAALPPNFALMQNVRWIPGAYVFTCKEPIALTEEEKAWIRAHYRPAFRAAHAGVDATTLQRPEERRIDDRAVRGGQSLNLAGRRARPHRWARAFSPS